MKKIITGIAIDIVVALIIVLIIVRVNAVNEAARAETLAGIEENQRLCDEALAVMNNTIEQYEKLSGAANIIFAFTDLSGAMGREAIAYMQENGYKGVYVFVDGKLPGDPGSITMAEYKALKANGWDFAMGTTGEINLSTGVNERTVNKWEDYVRGMIDRCKQTGIDVPDIYCFNENGANYMAKERLAGMGFDKNIIVGDYSAGNWFLSKRYDDNDYTGIIVDYNFDHKNEEVAHFLELGYSTVFLFNKIEAGNPQGAAANKNTSITRFKKIFEDLEGFNRATYVTNISGYKEYQAERNEDSNGALEELVKKITEYWFLSEGYRERAMFLKAQILE